jgi:vacuolar-type H+-ATPase subunit H
MQFLDNNDKHAFMPAADTSRESAGAKQGNPAEADLEYAIEAERGFEALKYAASLLTGTLLLDLTKSDRTVQSCALNEKARAALEEAREFISLARAKSENARHHSHHMRLALAYLEDASGQADREANLILSEADTVFSAVSSAWNELKKLNALVQGFQTVDLLQSCCAFHRRRLALP